MDQQGLLDQPVNQAGTNPKSQDNYDAFMSNGMKIIHDKKIADKLIKTILNADDPVKAIADVTLNVVSRLETGGQENGVELEPGVLAQAANELMGEIIMVAEMEGLEPLTEEEKYMSYSLAVSKYIDGALKSGKLSQEQLMEMANQAKQTPEGGQIVAEAGNIMNSQQAQPAAGGAQPMPPNTGRM